MTSIKIEDLPRELKINPEEMKAVMGGGFDPGPFKYKLIDPGDDERNIRPPVERLFHDKLKI